MSETSPHNQHPQSEREELIALSGSLCSARAVTAQLVNEVIHAACWRLCALPRSEDRGRIERLVEARAWTDAALALLELELPQWRIRRICYDEGEWCCALSRQRELPDWLDQSIESHHEELSLAILIALVEARRTRELSGTSVPAVPCRDGLLYSPLGCDNFS